MKKRYLGIVLITAFSAFIIPAKILNIQDLFISAYSVFVTTYLAVSVIMALYYEPSPNLNYYPSISILIPVYNEEWKILKQTIRHAIESTYLDGEKEVIIVDDGSTNGIKERLKKLKYKNLKVLFFEKNRGNKFARAEAIKKAKGEIVVFLDSDTFIDENSLIEIVKPFMDPEVGGVSGHIKVCFQNQSLITKLQSGWYYTSFRVYRAAEDKLDMVTCCPGAFSAYRRKYITPKIIQEWLFGKFLGLEVTGGVDRALTNLILRTHKIKYQFNAQAQTVVPSTFKKFLKQQIRWTKSWIRENSYASVFLWRKGIKSLFFYLSVVLHLANYIILFQNLFWGLFVLRAPLVMLFYMIGLPIIGFIYALFARHEKYWQYRIIFSLFYCWISLPIFLFSLVTLYNKSWMTR